MIIVRVFMKPKGVGPERLMGEAFISNDCTGTRGEGNYDVELSKQSFTSTPPSGLWKKGKVTGFPRLRLGIWDLLYRGLHQIVAHRNKEETHGADSDGTRAAVEETRTAGG